MTLLTILVFVCAVAHGHRIQPSSLILEEDLQQKLSADASAVEAAHSSVTDRPVAFETFANGASMIQEQASMTEVKDDQEKTPSWNPFAPKSIKPGETDEESGTFHGLKLEIWGIIVGSALVLLICCACCLANRRKSYLPPFPTRSQHVHNGRVVYEWDQTPKSATLYLKPPEGVRKNDLDIGIAAKHIRVGRKNKPSFLMEETFDLVNEEMSYWTLRNNGELQIVLRKATRGEWPQVLLHNEEASGLSSSG
mmetsp:Transcript_151749/g.268696  ORF Transcript_151749/g.268696 Transcript_151749/m.268696 type:complete len:252 (-) Transcript_151749:84-839(-)